MTRFDECLKFVLAREGGYCNHAADKGGATNCGITQKTYDSFRQSRRLAPRPVRDATQDEIATIYKESYYIPCQGPSLPQPLDLAVFDAAVNHGVSRATKLLQRTLGVDADGAIGRNTLKAVADDAALHGAANVANRMLDEREAFYRRIVENDPTQKVFLTGWLNRLTALEGEIDKVT